MIESKNVEESDLNLWKEEVSQRVFSSLLSSFVIVLISLSGGVLFGVYFSMRDKFIELLPVYAFPSVVLGLIYVFREKLKHKKFVIEYLPPILLFSSAGLGASLSDDRFLSFAILVNMPLFIAIGMSGLRTKMEAFWILAFAIFINLFCFKVFSIYPFTSVIGLWMVVLPIGLVSYALSISRYKLTKKSFFIGLQLKRSNDEIGLAHASLNKKHQDLETKSNEISASISYARYLQQAILPKSEDILKAFPNSFLIYKPKDVVSGDFYWLESSGDEVLVAVADCTGHGVPGAIVSVVCSNSLNRAIKEFGILDPGKILDKVRELVLDAFSKSGSEIKDGMDISLMSINPSTKQIKWAGANRPLWYIEKGELKEFKADKQAIGYSEIMHPFTTRVFNLSQGDCVYLFTDGYVDQFGGQSGKKFMKRKLADLIVENCSLHAKNQQKLLNEAFENWKGELEQVDDVCFLGIII